MPRAGQRPPSSRPSPQGEGESSAAFLKIRATGFVGRPSEKPKTRKRRSFSPGEKARMRAVAIHYFCQNPKKSRLFSAHKSKNGRTDGFSPARKESWLARNVKVSARIELSPHGRENGRTERFIAARRRNCSAQTGKSPARSDFLPHGVLADGHHAGSRNATALPECERKRCFPQWAWQRSWVPSWSL